MPKSAVEVAIDRIDQQIADFERAKQILLGVHATADAPEPKKRGRKKRGMPIAEKDPGLP